MLNVEIYGKDNCPWCKRAQELFDNLSIKYNYYTLNVDYTKEELYEKVPDAKTVPQIFINNKLIGGFNDIAMHLEEVLSGYAHDI